MIGMDFIGNGLKDLKKMQEDYDAKIKELQVTLSNEMKVHCYGHCRVLR